jgi:hypothetical protein
VCRCICQPKRHDKILIKPVSHRESRLGDIFITDFNLMIAGAEINLGEHLGSRQLIKQDIDAWERILVLDGDCIQRPVILTQRERPLSFFDLNNAGQPQGDELGRINPLSNKSFSWIFNSANSSRDILYGALEIVDVPGCNSILNSMALSGGILSKSSETRPGTRKPHGYPPTFSQPRYVRMP